jgi:REP element-mobilizing transposase RayT
MNGGYVIRDQKLPYFMTFTVVDWVDVFTRKIYRDIVIDSLNYCIKNKGMILYSYVIMSNHIHVIVQSNDVNLSDLVRDFKKWVAKNIIHQIIDGNESRNDWMLKRFEFAAINNKRNDKRQFWQISNHFEEVFTEEFFWTKINYIHMNPVRSGIVSKASDYLYSSASNYVGKPSLIDVTLADMPILDARKMSGYDIDIGMW